MNSQEEELRPPCPPSHTLASCHRFHCRGRDGRGGGGEHGGCGCGCCGRGGSPGGGGGHCQLLHCETKNKNQPINKPHFVIVCVIAGFRVGG